MLDFFNKRIFIIFIFPLILGGVTVLGFQPFNLFFVNFFSLPLLFFTIIYVKKNQNSGGIRDELSAVPLKVQKNSGIFIS